MLENVVKAKSIHVGLRMEPQDCSVANEHARPWAYLSKMFQYAELSKVLYKMRHLFLPP